MIDTNKKNLLFASKVLQALLMDAIERVPEAAPQIEADIRSLRGRGGRGYEFYLLSLPALCRELDVALVNERPIQRVPGLGWRNNKPIFLSGLLSRVLEHNGSVSASPDIDSVRLLRQITSVFKRTELPYAKEQIQQKIHDFLETENSCPPMSEVLRERPNRQTLADARALVESVFRRLNAKDLLEGWPHFSGGSVAEGYLPWEKPLLAEWYTVLDLVFPKESMLPQIHELRYTEAAGMYYDPVFTSELDPMIPSRPYSSMAFVPKTYKGPRVIGKEPSAVAFCQQLVKKVMYRYIEEHPLTKGLVNFTDQNINRTLALTSSLTGENATLDLADASNRNWFWVVASLFGGTLLWPYLVATRCAGIDIPRHGIQRLKMFSPMGSATTFPVEALTFWALASSCVAQSLGVPLLMASRHVYVYGDDIIVPTKTAQYVMQRFRALGFSMSESKCCISGNFRESCGTDAFRGEDVTPVKISHFPAIHENLPPEPLTSLVETRNLFYKRGYVNVVSVYDEFLAPWVPRLRDTGQELEFPALLGDSTYVPKSLKRRWNSDFQRSEFRGYVGRSAEAVLSPVDFRGALLASYLDTTGGWPRRRKQGRWPIPFSESTKRKWLPLPVEGLPDYIEYIIVRKYT